MTFTRVPGGPANPEELAFVGGTLYPAGGTAGIFAYDGAWRPLGNGVPSGPAWESITGYVDTVTGRPVLFAGCAQPVSGQHTLRSTDGGASWPPISTGPGVTMSAREYGQDTDWWAASKSYLGSTSGNFVPSMIAVDPDSPGSVVVAGRGGAYVGVQSPSSVVWPPAARRPHRLLRTHRRRHGPPVMERTRPQQTDRAGNATARPLISRRSGARPVPRRRRCPASRPR